MDAWEIVSNGKASLRNVANIEAINAFKLASPNITNDAIHLAFDGMKANRKQPFINGLKNVADNDLGLSNTRMALPNEVKDAVNNLRDYRKVTPSVTTNSNVAELGGTINGQSVSGLTEHSVWVGGQQNVLTPRPAGQPVIWQASNVQTANGFSYFADIDSEFNMLTDLARKLESNAIEGTQYLNHTGELKIVSEIPYCTSCQGIIQKFNHMFPNIKIILIDGIK